MNSWEQFCIGFKDFLNQPVPIIGFTIGAVLFFVLSIFAKTSIGKKALNTLKTKINVLLDELKNTKDELKSANDEFKAFKVAKEEEIKEISNVYETKLYAFKNELEKQDKLIKALCDNNHNKEVANAYNEYLQEKVDLAKVEFNQIVEEEKSKVENEYKEKYDEVKKELEELKSLIKGGVENGREERINDTTTSE